MRGLCELDEALTIVGGAALQSQHAGDLVRAERIGQARSCTRALDRP